MKNVNVAKGLALALLTALTVLFFSQKIGTASPQATQTLGRYQIAAYQYTNFNLQNQAAGQIQYLYKIDNQTGDTWWYNPRNNKWVKVTD